MEKMVRLMTDSNLQNFHIGQCVKGENEGKVKLQRSIIPGKVVSKSKNCYLLNSRYYDFLQVHLLLQLKESST